MNTQSLIERRRVLKNKLRKRQRVYAGWTSLRDPQITEVFANVGFDFIGIDIEHGTIGYDHAQRIIAAAQAGGTLCLPRIDSHSMPMIKRFLDSGADGIICPMVQNAQDVENLIEWNKYPPKGKRSFGINRGQNYGFDFDLYTSQWNDSSSLIVQIESVEGVKNIEKILSFDDVDGAMIGPYDLSGTLGVPGQIEHPEVKAAALHVLKACEKFGKSCGSQVVDYNLDTIKSKHAEGYNFLVISSDIFLLWKWAESNRQLLLEARKL